MKLDFGCDLVGERSSKEQSTAIGATPSETVQILLRTRLIPTDYEFSNLFLLLNRNLVHAPCVSASVECFSFFVLERGGNLGRPGLISYFFEESGEILSGDLETISFTRLPDNTRFAVVPTEDFSILCLLRAAVGPFLEPACAKGGKKRNLYDPKTRESVYVLAVILAYSIISRISCLFLLYRSEATLESARIWKAESRGQGLSRGK